MNIVPQSLVERHYLCSILAKGMRIHTSRGHFRCLCSRQKFVICEITIRLKQSACKRLLCLDSRCPPFHFGASVLQFGVGCLGNKAEQNTSAVSNSPKTSKSRCKSSKKKSNNSKNLWFSSISSHFLSTSHANSYLVLYTIPTIASVSFMRSTD